MREKFQFNEKKVLIALFFLVIVVMGVLSAFSSGETLTEKSDGTYTKLAPDTSTEDPIRYIDSEYKVKEGFHTNLPIVVLSVDKEMPAYKKYREGQEVLSGEDPYVTGNIKVIDGGVGENTLTTPVSYNSKIRIKMKGHSSIGYDKKQYKIKTVLADGKENDSDILGMGMGSEWVLNGSMADKSMIRNYLAYRIASEIGGNNMAPDSRFCEVLMEKNGKYTYQGVYLLMETISRGDDRVKIDKYNPKNVYSSYLVRRDRKTSMDPMLETYGRLSGKVISEVKPYDNWIGLKYPSQSKLTDVTKQYIEKDFSKMEKVVYSDDYSIFRTYDQYIDTQSFADYFLINEFFGNYDAGKHSTYMYKNSGEKLKIGPVWDYDQAMNNNPLVEMDLGDLAFQTRDIYAQICNDKKFMKHLKNRFAYLRQNQLSEEHLFDVIDETTAYLKSAQTREWYRWADDYLDPTEDNPGNYHLAPYEKDGVTLSRFTDDYVDEIYVIKNFLQKHGEVMQVDLGKLLAGAEYDTSVGGIRELLLIAALLLLIIPSYLIQRKG
ncbi:CotH kinase family protein [Butyrivibrio sp. M55]|uniref:CotH kinase family protein n=1 Tax=Butyrivibrio sp. M55 TaxID=1855323 RepID=UPI0008EDF330|nr:CotH kinase family protein [Butyrivibrio sp. M55]SFU78755.1 CotH protein [Butyrivibrio sp. M55]